ncbi:MAG: tetratricopeptide repeat protein, partial [Phormidesmis sp. CAN_BIN36]|nr:tetratricopeptide repeat protein [Phormidesmis sp. CAN_BIN36]
MSDQFDIDASGNARVNVIAQLNANQVNFGERTNFQQQVSVLGLDTIVPRHQAKKWVDRVQPQAELLQRIDRPVWLIELVAAGGFGKSSLAAWLFDQESGKFEKALWVGFRKLPTFNQFARWVLQEIGYLVADPRVEDEALVQELTFRLTERGCLLVMDQLEAVQDAKDAGAFEVFLQGWQRQGRKSLVLVTTRQGFVAEDDRVYLNGLTLHEGTTILSRQGITERIENGFETLVESADGHPLLLDLAASWLRQEAEGQIAEAALGFFERLFRNYQGNPEAKVNEIFAALFAELPERLQSLLLGVSVYRDRFGLEMAQAILPDASIVDLQMLEDRAFLRSLSLYKWMLHPLMLRSVQQALRDSGQEQEAHKRAIAYFTANIKPSAETIADCAEEIEIFHHYCELGQYTLANQIMDTCVNFLERHGYYRSLLLIYDQLTREWNTQIPTKTTERRDLSIAWTRLGHICGVLAQYQVAINCHLTSLEIQRQIGDRDGEGGSLCNLGLIYDSLGNCHKAVDLYQQSLEVICEVGNRQFEANTLGNLGNTYRSLAQYQEAIKFQQKSLEIKREIGDRDGEGGSLCNLGLTYASLGEYRKAVDLYEQSLKVIREVGNREFESNVLGNLGGVYDSLEEYELAIDFYKKSLEIEQDIGHRSGEASSLDGLANAYNSLEQYHLAIALYEKALEIEREIKDRNGESASLCNLANVYESLEEYQKAISCYHNSLEISREVGNRQFEANALCGLGVT